MQLIDISLRFTFKTDSKSTVKPCMQQELIAKWTAIDSDET